MKILKLFSSTLIFLICANPVYPYEYDPLLLRAQSAIYPKIILLDKEINNKTVNNNIIIAILYQENDSEIADTIKSIIIDKNKGMLGTYNLKVKVINQNKINSQFNQNISAYIVLNGTKDTFKQITDHAIRKKRIVFSYNYKDFSKNALISVLMKEKTYVYLNKAALHAYGVKFSPLFYKIAKIIE